MVNKNASLELTQEACENEERDEWRYFLMKKILALFMATTIAVGSMGVTAFGSVFADIKTVPWPGAATFIDEAQSLGLMNGYDENGKKYCKPRNNVTYLETVQMIYSIMKANGAKDVTSTDITKWTPVMTAYKIPSWAYASTVFALENKIISNNDLTKLRNGTENATREDVAVIFGKALEPQYPVNNSATLSYKDKSKVSAAAVPYLALLNGMKVMVGDSENNFNPKAKINRSEMAVLSVKTYKTLKDSDPVTPPAQTSGTVTGTVINSMVLANGDVFLSMNPATGAGLNLFGKKADVKVTFEKETVTLNDIGTGDNVTITFDGENLKTVVINKSVAGIHTKKTFPVSEMTTTRITVKDGSKSVDYRLDRDVVVYVSDKKQDVDYLIKEMKDAEFNATLSFDKEGYVTKIEAIKNANNPLSGDLSYLSDTKVTIKVGSKEYDYTLSDDDVSVKYGSKSVLFSTLKSDYKKNNHIVTLKLDSKGYVSGITIDYMEDETHGTLNHMNSRRLELSANGEIYKYDIDGDTKVEVDGKTWTISKFVDEYEDKAYLVALDVNRDDYVKEIIATSKNSGLSKGTLKDITSTKIKIEVKDRPYEYTLGDDPTVKIDGKTVSFSTFKKNFSDYSYEVELGFDSKEKVTSIVGTNKKATKGTLKSVYVSKDEVTITAVGVDYTYDLTSSAKATLDGMSIGLDELDEEIDYYASKGKIDATLTLSGDKVSKIAATIGSTSSTSGKAMVLKGIDGWEITVKDGSDTKTYPFASGEISMTLDGSSTDVRKLVDAKYDLYSDEVISVVLTFNNRDEVTKLVARTVKEDQVDGKATKGNLYSVSVSSDKIILKDSDDTKHTWYATSSVDVYYDLGSKYDEDDYDDDLDGLKDFLDDCNDENDDCYVVLTVNSSGKVTSIDAEDD